LIYVQASGDWTARLYISGFSFNSSTALSEVKILESKEGSSTSSLVVADPNDPTQSKFRVYTHSPNTSQVPREAFIVIELDKAPEEYSSVIMLSQNFIKQMYLWLPGTYPVGGLSAEGDDPGRKTTATATFMGNGSGLDTGVPDNSDTFIIASPLDDGKIEPWYSILVADGLVDDTSHFEIARGEFSPPGELYDREMHTVQVRAKGLNISGRNYQAILRAQVDPGTYVDIKLVQLPVAWNLPAVLPSAIAAVGGESAPLQLQAPGGMHYTVEIESFSGATNHFAYVRDPDDTAGTKYSKLLPEDTSKPFIVGFPKLIYPNLYGPASAVVKVTMVESGDTKRFTIYQNAPAQKTVNLFNVGRDWGGVSSASNKPTFTYGVADWNGYYCAAWANSFSNRDNFGTSGKVKITTPYIGLASAEIGSFTSVWEAVQNSVSIIHFTRPAENTATDWNNANSSIWAWINGTGDYVLNEGVLVVNAESDNNTETDVQFDNTHIPGMMGLTGGWDAADPWHLNPVENRLMDYLTLSGPFGAPSDNYTWNSAGNSSYLNISSVQNIPGAVPVLVGSIVGSDDHTGWCSLMIDPKRRIVVRTDSEMFSDNDEMKGFGQNVQAWIVNTAQYGTHFSDYFWDSPRYTMPTPTPQQ
jgi:hypothetical protein